MPTQLEFHETKFTSVKHNNQTWLTAVEIAHALGYKKSDAVTQIYDRNSDEFHTDMTETLNLRASGNYQKTVRVFSLRGAHLIAMFARTPVAKEFRRWVLDVLDRETSTQVATTRNPHRGHPVPTFRYIITLNYKDTVTGQEETFRGGANNPGEIIQGTAKRFGIFVSEMITLPVGAYL